MPLSSQSWPTQSATNFSTSPLVVRMFMKMSLDPAPCATSRSWWTSCQSRVAIAVLTIVVGVIGRLHSGIT